ncbi:non-ribosomal peptide synthetase [Micromonospora echinofusca]|uniref:Amino acid adenylation domain-containing protein n=1 Tax=Micromonospora echinofusca TaxID=47858 RepID=A0ABS3VS30_MICEH|nr:non-ribosomal peptide synthetase [Micromonospora echinofusca]MBO4207342.1 amino acid adenylation domain-containing protein [Micromonospora echinofusca]
MADSRRPLSTAQSGVWFGQQLDPASPAYNIGGFADIRGPADLAALENAIGRALAEAEATRLRFGEDGGEPWQTIGAPFEWTPTIVDVRAEPEPVAAAQSWMARDLGRPVSMTDGPLLGAALFRIAADHHLYYLRFHHVVLDAYAFSLFNARIAQIYDATRTGAPCPPTVPGSLPRVWAEEAAYRSSTRFAEDRDHWLARFADRPPVVGLTDRAAGPSHRVLRRRVDLSAETVDRLRAAVPRGGWNTTVVAAAASYLHRLTGAPDVVLGFPVTGRWGRLAKITPGMMMTILPLRLTIHPGDTFAALTGQAAEEIRHLLRHQRYRLEDLRTDLRALDDGRRLYGPCVNLMPFDYHHQMTGLSTVGHVLESGPVEDLSIDVYGDLDSGRVRIDFTANPARYDLPGITAHQDRFIRLLETLCRHPDTRVDRVPLLTPAEQATAVRPPAGTVRAVPGTVLPALLRTPVTATPHAPALIAADGTTLTYADLDARANRLAHELTARGAGPETVVAVALPRSVDQVVALLAVLKAGAAYLPVDAGQPADRLAFLLADARPTLLLTDRRSRVDLPGVGPATLLLDDPATGSALAARPSTDPTDADRTGPLDPDHPAYLLYTSGSTGHPKGVVVSHRAVVNHLLWMQDRYRLTPDDRVLVKTPAGFDVSVWEYFWPLLTGATAVLVRPDAHRDPRHLAQLIRDRGVTTAGFVPSMLREFVEEPAAAHCVTLRRTLCIGEALPVDLANRYAEVRGPGLENLYGPTETAVAVTAGPAYAEGGTGAGGADGVTVRASDGDPTDGVPVGGPAWNTRLYLLDQAGQPVPDGTVGELYVGGDQLARGYHDRPALTAERFLPDPFGPPGSRMYRTGDRMRRRADGGLVFVGRTDGQVKIRGNRIELGEIETVLAGHPDVGQAAVVVRAEPGGDQRLVGYLTPVPGRADPQSGAVRAWLADRLPGHMVPAALVVLPTLPSTSNGKVDRAALPTVALTTVVSGRAPRTHHEVVLCGLFAEILEVPLVGVDDSFFALGGHSLHAARLASRIRTVLDADLDLRTVFECPTVAGLADRLATGSGTPGGTRPSALDPLLPLRTAGSGTPLFCLPPVTGLSWCYSALLRHIDGDHPVYGLQSRGLAGGEPPLTSVPAMAADFADRIQAVHPGPYHLLGWSLGGILAYATATELSRRGAPVELLALLDAYPSDPELHTEEHRRVLLDVVLADFGYDPKLLDGESLDDGRVARIIRDAGGALADWPEERVTALLRTAATNLTAARRYRPEPYDGDLLLFAATLSQPINLQTVEDWRPHVRGRIDDVDIVARHEHMLRPAVIAQVGPILAERRRRLPARSA